MKSPAFQFYAQDFLTGCTYLTNEEIGMYVKMLCKQWTDGNIPKKRLGFLVGIEWDNFSDELKAKFQDFGDFIINQRLEKEREKKHNFIEKQSLNGKKGGRPKKNNKPELSENTQEETQLKPNPLENQNPENNQKKPLENRRLKTEKEKEIEKGKEGTGEKPEIVYPFNTETFRVQWQLWKVFRKKNDKFEYFNIESEQKALKELSNLSKENETIAIEIIKQSIYKRWKGFFALKNKENETSTTGFSKNR